MYMAPMIGPAVVMDPNHFSYSGAMSVERYSSASAGPARTSGACSSST